MTKTMCNVGKKKLKKRQLKKARYVCKLCNLEVRNKEWVCQPRKISA